MYLHVYIYIYVIFIYLFIHLFIAIYMHVPDQIRTCKKLNPTHCALSAPPKPIAIAATNQVDPSTHLKQEDPLRPFGCVLQQTGSTSKESFLKGSWDALRVGRPLGICPKRRSLRIQLFVFTRLVCRW